MRIAMAVTAVLTASLVSAVMGSSSSKKIAIPTVLKDMKVLALQETKASIYLDEERVSFQKVSDLEDSLQLVNSKKADVIQHIIQQLNYYINSDAALSLRVQPILLIPRLYALGIRNNSKLRKDLNRSILKVIQTSQWQRELDSFIPQKR
ncbi:transporter substrate-binding domain-containing protein [uncultured Christiangramia sp.]|uniref:transporter substrate-binding domain-containing protein n=1 Tax=uncultured Christiangramia sp. TaxID=503836 RepID=UPI0026373E3C|nr:transporter substrate-binding domain-containing protein [uncultured Christiangramia sp.]